MPLQCLFRALFPLSKVSKFGILKDPKSTSSEYHAGDMPSASTSYEHYPAVPSISIDTVTSYTIVKCDLSLGIKFNNNHDKTCKNIMVAIFI